MRRGTRCPGPCSRNGRWCSKMAAATRCSVASRCSTASIDPARPIQPSAQVARAPRVLPAVPGQALHGGVQAHVGQDASARARTCKPPSSRSTSRSGRSGGASSSAAARSPGWSRASRAGRAAAARSASSRSTGRARRQGACCAASSSRKSLEQGAQQLVVGVLGVELQQQRLAPAPRAPMPRGSSDCSRSTARSTSARSPGRPCSRPRRRSVSSSGSRKPRSSRQPTRKRTHSSRRWSCVLEQGQLLLQAVHERAAAVGLVAQHLVVAPRSPRGRAAALRRRPAAAVALAPGLDQLQRLVLLELARAASPRARGSASCSTSIDCSMRGSRSCCCPSVCRSWGPREGRAIPGVSDHPARGLRPARRRRPGRRAQPAGGSPGPQAQRPAPLQGVLEDAAVQVLDRAAGGRPRARRVTRGAGAGALERLEHEQRRSPRPRRRDRWRGSPPSTPPRAHALDAAARPVRSPCSVPSAGLSAPISTW